MAEFKFFKTWEKAGIADAASVSDSWIAAKDSKIKRIHLMNKDGSGLTGSTMYLKVAGKVYTHELVHAAALGPDCEVSPELCIAITKGEKLDWTFENHEGATIDIFVSLEIWTP